MKLLFDQNISPKLLAALSDIFPDSTHVQNVELEKASDIDIWNFARKYDYIIISKDSDFSERSLVFGYPPFVVWIRRGNCSTKDIINLLKENFESIKTFAENKESGVLNIY